MTLPLGFNSLTIPQQLLVVSNLERVGRGLVPAGGLSAGLDATAAAAASAYQDPNPGAVNGDWFSANWAGGTDSPLVADFEWMYDDGPGSGNLECTSADYSGCWGHRHDILYSFDAPLVMGAGEASGAYGPSLTEIFVGGAWATGAGQADEFLAPTWSTISQSLQIGLSETSLAFSRGVVSRGLEITSSGVSMHVGAWITSGSLDWRVSPSSCDLAARSSCELTIADTSVGAGSTGTLTLLGPDGYQSVALTSQVPATLRMAIAHSSIAKGSTVTVRGHLADARGVSVEGEVVRLYQRAPGSTAASPLAKAHTSPNGSVNFRVSPHASTKYSLVFTGSATLGASSTRPAEVRVSRHARNRPRASINQRAAPR